MRAVELIRNVLTSNERFLERALDGLTDADLMIRPSEESNPIGWLLWHQTRVEDATIAAILEQPQVWVEQDWVPPLGMAADAEDLGIGHTLDQVMALQPSLTALSGYRKAVRERTLSCLAALADDDLEGEITIAGRGTGKAKDYLTGLTMDHTQHTGQVAYLRGYLSGKGWFPA
ncbi:DinB family protein [Candidatus Entotheonella palauensis]|uniref:DinB family protein n=1 Tax=Candidatus Entotheonella palauensis TaxID=93172 RepID=UPI000B7FE477|nr:DinB family protein [Candidatus Entotheonella palauensis]